MHVDDGRIEWDWRDTSVVVGITRAGAGPVLLMLPALSSISTRGEMRPLARLLADEFTTVTVDWPGFGQAPRPAIAWRPAAYRAFLAELLEAERPFATIAAGHAAGYCVAVARSRPGSAGRLVLVAPTWRGPLPTVTGKRHAAFGRIARAGDLPVLGEALYRLNVNPFMVKKMALGHVYVDAAWLDKTGLPEPGSQEATMLSFAASAEPNSRLSCQIKMRPDLAGIVLRMPEGQH